MFTKQVHCLKLYPFNRKKKALKIAFFEEPFPIICPEKRIVLLWSAKSGCTFAMKWMFSQMGILEDAQAFHPWVHRYRLEVYFESRHHKNAFRLLAKNPDKFHFIKIVYNPYLRAVRSFIHASIYSYEDKLLSNYLNRVVDAESRFSFREFVRYLTKIDLNRCNTHHRLQTTDVDRIKIVKSLHLIHLEDSMNEIPSLEKQLQLESSDLKQFRKSPHHRPKYRTDKFMGDAKLNDIYGIKNAHVPEPRSFYDAEIQAMVARAYHEDFVRFNYDPSGLPW